MAFVIKVHDDFRFPKGLALLGGNHLKYDAYIVIFSTYFFPEKLINPKDLSKKEWTLSHSNSSRV